VLVVIVRQLLCLIGSFLKCFLIQYIHPFHTVYSRFVKRLNLFAIRTMEKEAYAPKEHHRLTTLQSWSEQGGVLLISFDRFRLLASGIK
jgi:hypothetical protein